jgi:GNAT superfamily N-acetyltransferase
MGAPPHIATRPRIRRASVSDVGRIARLFTASFARDPVFDWLARTGKSRDGALERFFRWTIRERSLPHGETWMTEDGMAAAVWIPPYSEASDPTFFQELQVLPTLFRLTGLGRLPRGIATASAMEHSHPKEPYFYLALIGVAPGVRRSGLGSFLLADTLARVDAVGVAAYLENSNPKNAPFYEHAGFSVTKKIASRKDAPPLYAMWRPSRTKRS